jgi:hypothetical protein
MILNFIKYFIITNPVKLTYIFLITLMMGWGIKVDYITYQKPLDTSQDYKFIKRGDTYFIPIFDENLPTFHKTEKIENVTFGDNFISYKDIHPIVILSYLLSGVFGIILIVCSFISDRDANWGIDRIYKESKLTQIFCDEENGEFFYHINGKLLKKSKNREIFTKNSDLFSQILKTPNQFPDYSGTKSKIRDKKLDLILS